MDVRIVYFILEPKFSHVFKFSIAVLCSCFLHNNFSVELTKCEKTIVNFIKKEGIPQLKCL